MSLGLGGRGGGVSPSLTTVDPDDPPLPPEPWEDPPASPLSISPAGVGPCSPAAPCDTARTDGDGTFWGIPPTKPLSWVGSAGL